MVSVVFQGYTFKLLSIQENNVPVKWDSTLSLIMDSEEPQIFLIGPDSYIAQEYV